MRWTIPLLLLLVGAAPAPDGQRRIMLSGFDRIRLDGPFEVHVAPGSAKAIVSGDRRAIDRIEVRQEGGTLIIAPSLNTWGGGWPGEDQGGTPTIVEVNVPSLRSASVVGSGRLAIDSITGATIQLMVTGAGMLAVKQVDADQLNATITGTGTIAVQGQANKARFFTNGTGGFDAGGLIAGDLMVHSESAGSSHFAARYTANVLNLGLGDVQVDGKVACTVQGPGPTRCGKGK